MKYHGGDPFYEIFFHFIEFMIHEQCIVKPDGGSIHNGNELLDLIKSLLNKCVAYLVQSLVIIVT